MTNPITAEIWEGIRARHSLVESAGQPTEAARAMAYLSHLDRRDLIAEVVQLRGNLSLAEDGLANYALEVERLRAVIRDLADATSAHNKYVDQAAHAVQAWPPRPAAEPSEHPILMEDRAYYDGARQAAAMAHQSLKSMDEWIAGGCGNRVPAVKSNPPRCDGKVPDMVWKNPAPDASPPMVSAGKSGTVYVGGPNTCPKCGEELVDGHHVNNDPPEMF
ncbi:MAG: hypothetical protein JWO52_4124 [Gammaproteobacteria bacterium]|nr:hypothetical protein [Gammaproteobacteria bacterium]